MDAPVALALSLRGSSHLALHTQLARRSYRRMATYRAATVAGVFTNTVFGFLRAYVLLAMFDTRVEVGGFDAIDTLTYTFLTQALLATVGIGGLDLADRIRTGDVVADLYRPMDFQGYWAAQEVGRFAFQVVFRGFPPFLVGALVFTLRLPPDAWTAVAFALCLVFAGALSFAWRFLVTLSGFWLLDARGAVQLGTVILVFLSGFMVPLNFFPEVLVPIVRALPFAGMVQLPVEVFLGHHRGIVATARVLAFQAVWALILVLTGRHVVARALRKVVVQGG